MPLIAIQNLREHTRRFSAEALSVQQGICKRPDTGGKFGILAVAVALIGFLRR
jgi:hypothetical protein